MTRQRKEILEEMNALYMQEQAEYEMGCGFGREEISRAFEPLWKRLDEKLASTYGKTVEEYEAICYESQKFLCEKGLVPFN